MKTKLLSGWRLRLLLSLLLALVVIAVVLVVLANRPSDLPHSYDLSPTTFSFRYPDGWMYQIPEVGILVAAPPETLGGEAGPSFTVQRSTSLMMQESLMAALDLYLAQGPLRPNRAWELVGEVADLTFNGRPAVMVELAGSEFPDWPQLYTRVVMAEASNRVIYVLAVTTTQEDWEADRPLLESILASVEILE
ncbi:MAG: hypothetical protein JW910_15575 [Anaerolineae bacterium]|nr:hypothetical protein [Anaerolineae bacterium]